jgi:hypothetical protein
MRDQKSTKIVLQGRPSFSGLSAILVEKPSASCNVLGNEILRDWGALG